MSSPTPFLKDLSLLDPERATAAQKQILDHAQKQAGFLPNMYRGMANAPAVLSTYLHGYALFRSESGLTPAEQEVVLLAISQVNKCDYCMAAHSMIAAKRSGVPDDVLQAIRGGRPIPDRKLAAIHRIAAETVSTRGEPSPEAWREFREAGYEELAYLYVVLAVAVKTLSNYTNHAFGTPLDASFAGYKVS